MAPHSSTLAWKIPWTEYPGELQSMGSLRVGHDWTTSLSLFTFMHWRRKWQPTPVSLPGESQGAWWAAIYGVTQSRTGLKWLSSSSTHICMCSVVLILCNPLDCSLPGSSVHGILQARILEWVAMLSFRRSSLPRDWTSFPVSPVLAGGFFTTEPHGTILVKLIVSYLYWWISQWPNVPSALLSILSIFLNIYTHKPFK